MYSDSFDFTEALAPHWAGATQGEATALAAIAELHESYCPYSCIRHSLTFAWWKVVCESPGTNDFHRRKLSEAEESLLDEDKVEAERWIGAIRTRIQKAPTSGIWTKTIVPSDEDLVSCWLKHHETEDGGDWEIDGWAVSIVSNIAQGDLPAAWSLTQELLSRHKTERQLGMVGVTLLEGMIWNHIAEAPECIVPHLRENRALRGALSCVWVSNTDPRRKYIVEEWLTCMARHGILAEDFGEPYLPVPQSL